MLLPLSPSLPPASTNGSPPASPPVPPSCGLEASFPFVAPPPPGAAPLPPGAAPPPPGAGVELDAQALARRRAEHTTIRDAVIDSSVWQLALQSRCQG